MESVGIFQFLNFNLHFYTVYPYINIMDVTFIETVEYSKKIENIATFDEILTLEEELINNPYKGKIIQGTGGARKIRLGVRGKGKSGGVRIIYYFVDARGELWLLDIYTKSEKENLTEAEKKRIFNFVKRIIQ